MSPDSNNSQWNKRDWIRAIVAGTIVSLVITYLIEPFITRSISATSALVDWISDDIFEHALMYAKGGTEYFLSFVTIGIFTIIAVSILVITFSVTFFVAKAILRSRQENGLEITKRKRLRKITHQKAVLTLSLLWILGFSIIISFAQNALPLAIGFLLKIGFENAIARLAPEVEHNEILMLQSKWWGMRGKKDYEILATEINKIAADHNIYIGDALTLDYKAIVEPKTKN